MTSPRDYGVPHSEWREHQFETVKWIADRPGPVLVQAPTGSGKSGIACALGHWGPTRVLTHTINLQQQYEDQYGFTPIYGVRHYPCELLAGNSMCDSCLFPEKMHDCPISADCHYIRARKDCEAARRQVLSYAYYLAASWPNQNKVLYNYLDEAHLLPQIVKDAATLEYTRKYLYNNNLPNYPDVAVNNSAYRIGATRTWLGQVALELKDKYNLLSERLKRVRRRKDKSGAAMLARRVKDLGAQTMRLDLILYLLEQRPEDFFCHINEDRYKLVPLTARHFFSRMFLNSNAEKTVLTSATLGNPETLATELGIRHFSFRDTPSRFTPEQMPVYVFKDAPQLGYSTEDSAWKKWAAIISFAIKQLDPSWSGLIHVSSYSQAKDLASKLSNSLGDERIYIPEGRSTADKIAAWRSRKIGHRGTICISPSFHMGLDAPDDNFNIVAKIPFTTLDEFGQAELEYNPGWYNWKAAMMTEQASGRIRRGEPEHYENGNGLRKFVAIADGNYVRVKDNFSQHFRDCLTEM